MQPPPIIIIATPQKMTEIYSFLLNLLSASIPSATAFSPNFLKAITNEETVYNHLLASLLCHQLSVTML